MRNTEKRTVPWGTTIAAAAATFAATFATPPAAASSAGGAQAAESPPELRRARRKAWWLDFWAHSMQERAFVEWMTQSTGGIEWMHVMPIGQVNALYAWWLAEIWFGTGGSSPP